MATEYRKEPGTQLLQELEALSESMYQTHVSSTNRRTASLVLPRDAVPPIPSIAPTKDHEVIITNPKPRARRMSLSPWRSRPKEDNEHGQDSSQQQQSTSKSKWTDEPATTTSEKKGSLWNWKPIRALTHITMQKLSCLFSIEVVTVQNLPASMNGLRLSVCVRKKENKDGAVQTMPSRVSHAAADFEETLFIRCHVYYTPSASGTHMKFEPRPFLVYVLAVDAEEVDLGRSNVDLSALIQESVEKSFEGSRVRQWDTSFKLSGKAKGGELVLKLGFQIMEKDGGVGIYTQAADGQSKSGKSKTFSPSIGRKQSKSSFSVPSPRMSSRAEAWTPSQKGTTSDLQGIDELNLDEPAPPAVVIPPPAVVTTPPAPEKADEEKGDDIDLLDFDVEEKGVEMEKDEDEQSEGMNSNSDVRSVSSEVVKEVVHDQPHVVRKTELDSIAQQIKALESMMGEEKADTTTDDNENGLQTLDADEDKVTREFLQQLEDGEIDSEIPQVKSVDKEDDDETEVLLPDLGKGLGCVVQTRNGGYLAAMNPLDTTVARKDTPKLAMQISKPLILQSNVTGFELFQKIAATGIKDLTSEISSLMPIDELVGKTAEQIAFEGIASAIIQGREKEGASSTAARSIAAVKSIATAMNNGRKERVSTGIWNVSEESLTLDEILAFSMQKIENMSVDALKIQAGMAEEDAPFDISPVDAKTISASGIEYDSILASAIPVEDALDSDTITICVLVQLRDPLRLYESVGGPMIALIHAVGETDKSDSYKVASMQIGSVKAEVSKSIWDTEKQKLTALQWLVAYGMGKPPLRKVKRGASKGQDVLWSISSRVMADMWLKPIRNPDVKFTI